MPNIIDANGLQVSTRAEILDFYDAELRDIFGDDIDLSSNTPDGQLVNDFIQSVLDLEDLLVQVNNMFDPDNAIGVILDQRVAINGIQRQAGTFTITNVTLVVAQALNLYGIDQELQSVFTVSDNAGNEFVLQATQNIDGPGTYVFAFQAAVKGAVLTVPNTITVPVSIVLGVTSINNPTPATTVGLNEESDSVLKVRRQKSVSLASQGYLAGLLAALENINGVTSAFVYENNTSGTDIDGIPGHSIWVIVAGSGAASEIAEAIYTKRNAGCGMFGAQSFLITQVNGQPFVLYWDTVIAENLFIQMTLTSLNGTAAPNVSAIREGLPLNFDPGVNSSVNINALGTAVQEIDPNALSNPAGFSTGRTQILSLSGIAASGAFKVVYNGEESAAIDWDDSISDIQTKIQDVDGLAGATVTGSIAGQLLTVSLAAVSLVMGLLSITDNTLETGGAVDIVITNSVNFSSTLSPSTKNREFVVASENIIILPMLLAPIITSVTAGSPRQFTGMGGYGELTYSIAVDNSGATIDQNGLYTSGMVASVEDTVRVTDVFGNFAESTVTVV